LFQEIVGEGFWQSLDTMLMMIFIIVPIMIFLEYARYWNIMERLSKYFGWFSRWLGLPAEASFPLMVGMVIGLVYGMAVIIDYSQKGLLSKKDLLLVGVFLAINHGIIEDNLLFAAMGANIFLIFIARFIVAFLVTRLIAHFIPHYQNAHIKAN